MVVLPFHEIKITTDVTEELNTVVFALFTEHSNYVHSPSSFN